jgi:hypothetical protein
MKLLARSSPPVVALLAALVICTAARAAPAGEALPTDPGPAYGARLEGFGYPWPVALYRFRSQGQALEMAYMDVKPGASQRARRLHTTSIASGIVVRPPTRARAHPAALRWSLFNRPESNSPIPTPKAARVPARSMISAIVSFRSIISLPTLFPASDSAGISDD